jgi:hypothetical protein
MRTYGADDADDAADPITRRITEFIAEIGLALRWEQLTEPTQLPGIAIDAGELVVDLAGPGYPGDLLHEAGHLAVLPAVERACITGNAGADGGIEMSAIAWSYAAARHLGCSGVPAHDQVGPRLDALNASFDF